jgi:hypothetical protein
MDILLYNLKIEIQKLLLNLITNKILTFFGIRFIGVGLKYNTLDVLIFQFLLLHKSMTSFL